MRKITGLRGLIATGVAGLGLAGVLGVSGGSVVFELMYREFHKIKNKL